MWNSPSSSTYITPWTLKETVFPVTEDIVLLQDAWNTKSALPYLFAQLKSKDESIPKAIRISTTASIKALDSALHRKWSLEL